MPINSVNPLGSSFNPFAGSTQAIQNEIGEAAGRFEEIEEMLNRIIRHVAPNVVPGGGGAIAGIVIEASGEDYNNTYAVQAADGSSLELTGLVIVPHNRMFDIEDVDFEPAEVPSTCTIVPLAPFPLDVPGLGIGGCWSETTNKCTLKSESSCSGIYLGDGSPCAFFNIPENVKISECPNPQPALPLPAPPVIGGTPGLLT